MTGTDRQMLYPDAGLWDMRPGHSEIGNPWIQTSQLRDNDTKAPKS